MAHTWPPPRLPLLWGCVVVARLTLNIDAARVDGAGSSSRMSVPFAVDNAAARAQRDRDLNAAATYIDSIDVQDYLCLGYIKDVLKRLEDIGERVTSFRAARDARSRLQIRKILREVKEKGDALKVIAGKLEAEGHVDDGGDELPTQRDSICSHISRYHVEFEFVEMVQLFCEYLDTVRKTVNAGDDEEPMAYCVSGLLNSMATKPEYRRGHIGREIDELLGEERRWVAKHLAPWPAGIDRAWPSPEKAKTRFRSWPLRAWEIQMFAEVDTVALPFKALQDAHDALVSSTVDGELAFSSIRTRIQRLEFCKLRLVPLISRSDPGFRKRIRDVLHELKERMDALRALAERKLSAGEVDSSSDLLPSQRDNICTKLNASGLEQDFCSDVQKLCATFDKLHSIANIEQERGKGVFELLGRMVAIRRKPGYSETPVASEIESLLAEEWSWLEQQEAVIGA